MSNVDKLISYNKSTWCVVDADNIFSYRGYKYKIDESLVQYRVTKRYDEVYNFENSASMTKVLVTEYSGFLGDKLDFKDENFENILVYKLE